MRSIDESSQQIWNDGGQKLLQLYFEDGTVLDNDDIYAESMEITETLCDETTIKYGKCCSNQFKLKIYATSVSYQGKRFQVQLTINPIKIINNRKVKYRSYGTPSETISDWFGFHNNDTCFDEKNGIYYYGVKAEEYEDGDEPILVREYINWHRITSNIENKERTISLGYFTVNSEQRTSDKMYRDIVAYDDVYKLSNIDVSSWYENLPWSNYNDEAKSKKILLKTMTQKLFEYIGIEYIEHESLINNLMITKTINPTQLSALDVVQNMAELYGAFGHIGYDGKFRFIILRSDKDLLYPNDDLYPSDDLYPQGNADFVFSMNDYKQGKVTYDDVLCRPFDSVCIKENDEDVGYISPQTSRELTNTYNMVGNFLTYAMNEQSLFTVTSFFYETNQDVYYTPASMETWSKPWLELGDYIEVQTKTDTIKFPILKRTFNGITGLSDKYEAKGTEYFSSQTNSLVTQIAQLKSKTFNAERNITDTLNEVVLKVNSDDKMVQVALGVSADDDEQASYFKVNADNIDLSANDVINIISNNEINLSTKHISITSDNFSVDADGNATFKGSIQSGSTIDGTTLKTSERESYNDDVTGIYIDNDVFDFCWTEQDSSLNDCIGHFRLEKDKSFKLILDDKVMMKSDSNERYQGINIGKHVEIPALVSDTAIIDKLNVTSGNVILFTPDSGNNGTITSLGYGELAKSSYLKVFVSHPTFNEYYTISMNESSDKRLKNNIADSTENALDKINQIKFRGFDWNEKSNKNGSHESLGVVADEIENIIPNSVITPNDGYKTMHNYPLIMYSMKAIQEMSGIIEKQQKEIDELKKIVNIRMKGE